MSSFHDPCGIAKCFPEIITKGRENAVAFDNRNSDHDFIIGRLQTDIYFYYSNESNTLPHSENSN